MPGPGGYLPVHDKAHRMMQAVRLGIPSHNPVLKSHVFLQKFRRLLNIRTLFQLFHGHRDNKPGHADFPPRGLGIFQLFGPLFRSGLPHYEQR